ncbi:MAG: pilus assembly protein N-terminal domain-containing protein [Pirellulales bacterium]|nr:pilus assembly protein N-terminal domain-containing protein [Pirellulales bacterium]
MSHNITQSIERLEMLVKSSRILTLEGRIPKFQVHNEEVLGATPVSQNQLQIFAKVPGTTQLNLWDTNDKLYTVDIVVLADAREVEGILSSQLPLASLKVTPVNNSAIVSGSVTSVDDVDRAVAIVEQFYATVVNNIKVVGVQQVLLHTRIMEVSRTKFRDLGVDLAIIDSGNFFVNAPGNLINAPGSTLGGALPEADAANVRIFTGEFEALIAALRRQDLVKFLAEPTVVATHGRPARFIVGGRVPYIVPSGDDTVTINYEEFGTSVDFLPFVVGPGRIRLEVRPEVTEPDNARSIEASGIVVPAFTSRYVETAVELQAGQTFAIAGLLQSRTESNVRATPFFGELPYVGAMFRRVQERRNDIELLITVTPELVDAMNPHEVPRGGPGLNSTSPTDSELYLKGHLEVPNLLGSDCNYVGGDGFSSIAPGQGAANVLPPGAIVPGDKPVVVGEGVTVTSPSE